MMHETVLQIICVVLLLALIGMVLYSLRSTEGFTGEKEDENVHDDDHNNVKLDKKEEELFEDLRNNKLEDTHVDKLIEEGVLTEELVEKFLAKLDKNNKEEFSDPDTAAAVLSVAKNAHRRKSPAATAAIDDNANANATDAADADEAEAPIEAFQGQYDTKSNTFSPI